LLSGRFAKICAEDAVAVMSPHEICDIYRRLGNGQHQLLHLIIICSDIRRRGYYIFIQRRNKWKIGAFTSRGVSRFAAYDSPVLALTNNERFEFLCYGDVSKIKQDLVYIKLALP
jgi:hypothetical protein